MMLRQAFTSEPGAFPRVAPARPRTVSRANPPFSRNLPPHARASARFHWEKPPHYDETASSGSVVGNDPVDNTDPSGLCPSCVGAVIGAGIELGIQVFTQTVIEGKDLRDVDVDWVDVGISAAAGATGASALKVAGKFFKAEAAAARGENAAARLATARERAQSAQIARRAAQAQRAASEARAARSDTVKAAAAAAAVTAGKKIAQTVTPPPGQGNNSANPPPPPPPPPKTCVLGLCW